MILLIIKYLVISDIVFYIHFFINGCYLLVNDPYLYYFPTNISFFKALKNFKGHQSRYNSLKEAKIFPLKTIKKFLIAFYRVINHQKNISSGL